MFMDEPGVAGDENWDSMFENIPEGEEGLTALLDFGLPDPYDDPVSFSIDDLEQLLMADGGADVSTEQPPPIPDDFFSDLILDSPAGSEVVDVADDVKNSDSNSDSPADVAAEEGNKEDPLSKKQRRQLRNRDAAVRSRERKKMYVKDLEMKSRYLEGECRRLGMLLQCCSAENHALRLSLQNAKTFDASVTKQESAVLFLESLLLGSLHWFLGIVCLFILPRPLPPRENVDEKVQGSLVLLRKKPQSHDKGSGTQISRLIIMSRRCRASRARMKESSFGLEILV